LYDGLSPLDAMIDGARGLERSGAGCITIVCNTAHHWATEIAAAINIPLLHIADAVLDEMQANAAYGDSIGILSTTGTLKSGFYQQRFKSAGYRVLLNTEKELEEWVGRAILLTKQGDVSEGGRLLGLAAQVLRERGSDKLLFAFTEIPVALARVNHESMGYGLDATRALAQGAVAWWQRQSRSKCL
jgi:aspartate racemase